ncbi:GNAT family N-acetyltransferase [Legionella micdadei]|uniref:Acetyltransferase n=1 Tax=Legionella micdadei TaxID=451 RepID=A0A098GHK8_LEGMI|nr:GNAT family N-acetyltransferase [Legionella micdadei]ARG96659.1 GNAT family N-acetyltransferase [Legionella micdadei]ARG99406.1 GNAT family N-acetyltransferase [Legionella micdadei]KTD26322.1 putative transcriptional regulator, MarR family [Legionella micdadei]NSL19102.1 GNAT family N-acetyltransferase [Legionella micdadei]CEG61968.1 putative Acyl-CoA N-acyltransferase [Legionella micdadei]
MKIIREMMPQDNEAMAKIIVTVLAEHGFKDERTGGYDINNLPPKIKELFSYIYRQGGKFFVVEETDTRTVLGGGGFLPRITSSLCSNHYGFFSRDNCRKVCELEKFYFLPEIRGTGLASQLMDKIQTTAINQGYQAMYIETEPSLERAHHFYEKMGFTRTPVTKENTTSFFKWLEQISINDPDVQTKRKPWEINFRSSTTQLSRLI